MPLDTSRAAAAASPLWIIALFIALSEVTSGVAAMTTNGVMQLIFGLFSVAFPVLVFAVFATMLVRWPANLYAPQQFPEHTGPEKYAQALAKQPAAKQAETKEIAQAITSVLSSIISSPSPVDGRRIDDEVAARLERVLDRAGTSVDRGLLIDADTVIEEGSDTRGEFASAAAGVPGDHEAVGHLPMSNVETDLDVLAARYDDIRQTQRPGFERTSAMTSVVQAMIEASATVPSLNWMDRLFSEERGVRLTAYAYLHVRPECSAAEPLVASLTKVEDKPFGQFWALKALRRVLATCDRQSADAVVEGLLPFGEQLAAGTDRRIEFDQIVKDVKGGRES